MIDLAAEAAREQNALRLGLPADSHELDILRAVLIMTQEDIELSVLQALVREMGGRLRVELVLPE